MWIKSILLFRVAMVAFLLAASLCLSSGMPSDPGSAPFNELGMRMKSAEVEIQFLSPEAGEQAELSVAPLPEGKSWAFSARWDDNNLRHLRMRDLMAEYGYEGGFYLNDGSGKAGAEFAKELVEKGCGLGGHGMTHPYLALENVNDIFWQVMANRVKRESDSDTVMVAYAFSFNMFKHEAYPDAHGYIGEALQRAGWHHIVQSNFIDPEKGVYPETFSVSRTLLPGDKDADPEKFTKYLDLILKNQTYQEQNPIVTLGIHTWQTEEGFQNLEQSLARYAGNPDWWYCEPNEYGAYRYRFHNTRIERLSLEGATARYQITTPVDGDAGRPVPLDLIVEGAGPIEARMNGKLLSSTTSDGKTVVTLFQEPDWSLPQQIDMQENSGNTPFTEGISSRYEKSAGLVFHLRYDVEANQAILTASNLSSQTAREAHLFLRLPPMFKDGNQSLSLSDLSPGEEREEIFDLGEIEEDPVYTDGAPFLVAQIDFLWGEEPVRFYAVCRDEPSSCDRDCPRDRVRFCGPFREADSADFETLSDPEVPLSLSGSGLSEDGWARLPVPSRRMYRDDCIVNTYNKTNENRSLLEKAVAAGESGNVAYAFDFIPSADAERVELKWPGKLKSIFLNGKEFGAEDRFLPVRPDGLNRIILIPDESARDLSRRPMRYAAVGFVPAVNYQSFSD